MDPYSHTPFLPDIWIRPNPNTWYFLDFLFILKQQKYMFLYYVTKTKKKDKNFV